MVFYERSWTSDWEGVTGLYEALASGGRDVNNTLWMLDTQRQHMVRLKLSTEHV